MNTENNKTIAVFLGNNPSNNGLYTINEKTTRPSELQYHSNWNWLMEVVEKIDYLERNTDNEVFIQKVSNVTSLPLFTPKHTVYNACLEFINWYNLQKS